VRRHRAFSFITLSRFAWYVHTAGDEAAVAAAHGFRQVVRSVLSGMGVRVHMWMGEAIVLVGTEIEPLIEATVAIDQAYSEQPHALAVQGGMSSGDVLMLEGSDYVGDAVCLAFWLAGAAAPGELLVTAEVAEHVKPPLGVVERGTISVPNLQDVEVFSLRAPVSVISPFDFR